MYADLLHQPMAKGICLPPACFGPWIALHICPARALCTWRHQHHPRKTISDRGCQLLLRLQLITLPLATAHSITPFNLATLQALAAPCNASRAETLQGLNTSPSVPLADCWLQPHNHHDTPRDARQIPK